MEHNPHLELLEEIRGLKSYLQEIAHRLPEEKQVKRYSPKELSESVPLSVQTIRSKIKQGTIQASKLGRKYLITAEEFERVCKEVKSLKYKRSA